MKYERIEDENTTGLEDRLAQNLSPSSQKIIESSSSKSYSYDRPENIKIKLKLVDGNVDHASVIKEGNISQTYPSQYSAVDKISSHDSPVSKVSKAKCL